MRDRSDFIARRVSKMLRAAPGTKFRAFGRFQGQPSHRTARLGNVGPMTTAGKYRIMIYGPKEDRTYVVEFRTDAGQVFALSIPSTETAVIRRFQERMPYGLSAATAAETRNALPKK
jgi:hypothetical protein